MGAIIRHIMFIVTGGARFIGSNLVRALCERGKDVIVVDDLTDGRKFINLADCDIQDYWDKDELLTLISRGKSLEVSPQAVFHQGACSDTTEWDGQYMMQTNFEYSKRLLDYCGTNAIPFLYASSASVYGSGPVFNEDRCNEAPLNVYAYSKCLLDRYVRRVIEDSSSQIVGLRYFNVYGPREAHKGKMASIAWQLHQRMLSREAIALFEGSDGYADGEQRRDFVHVDDVVKVNLWFLEHPDVSGVFNLGTGRSQTFNDVARAVIAWHGGGEISYVPFPGHLQGRYQSFAEADISALRACGYEQPFLGVEEGVHRYLDVVGR